MTDAALSDDALNEMRGLPRGAIALVSDGNSPNATAWQQSAAAVLTWYDTALRSAVAEIDRLRASSVGVREADKPILATTRRVCLDSNSDVRGLAFGETRPDGRVLVKWDTGEHVYEPENWLAAEPEPRTTEEAS